MAEPLILQHQFGSIIVSVYTIKSSTFTLLIIIFVRQLCHDLLLDEHILTTLL